MNNYFEVTEERIPVTEPAALAVQVRPDSAEAPRLIVGDALATVDEMPAVFPISVDSQALTEPATDETVPDPEEQWMTISSETPPGGFPKSIHGYSVAAVDDYIRKINSRLDSLVAQLQAESSRADQSKRLLEQMTTELEMMRRRASDAEQREAAALEGRKQSELEAARLVQELREAREKAKTDLDAVLGAARHERDAMIEEEREHAEALAAEAQRSAAAQIAEAQKQLEPLLRQVTALSAEIETLRGRPGSAQATAEPQQSGAEDPLADQRDYLRTQIDLVVAEARRSAEQAEARATEVYREQEQRIRALADEFGALVGRVRGVVESQPVQVQPTAERRPAGEAEHAATRSDDAIEKPIRERRDWRSGAWRSAS